MTRLQEEKLRIKQEIKEEKNAEYIRVKSEALAKKIKKMTPQEYDEFMKEEVRKARLLEAKLEDNQDKVIKLIAKLNKLDKTSIKESDAELSLALHTVVGLYAGVLCGGLMGGTIGMIPGAICGVIVGVVTGLINNIARKKKPISKLLNKIRLNILKLKVEKLQLQNDFYKV